eukprot:309558-Alexandrium_andersonii.AAC.1
MSASLVGSEMCIRDRPEAVPGKARAALGASCAVVVVVVVEPSVATDRSCLLYTSDAADDM